MRIKSLAHKNQMGKKKIANSSTSWVPSEFSQSNLTKAQKEGLIAAGDQVIFPSTERIPKPPSGYRVMFLAFLLRDLSFPSHEFLRGLLFVYGVQLHQLTPNSILHIACFITLCENPKGETSTAPVTDTPASDEPPSQEVSAVVKLPEAPVKKGNPRASKHLKKAARLALPLIPIDR
jgi:hypothetical protein